MAKEIINIDFNPESIIEFLTKIKNETPSAMEKMMKTARVFMKNTVNENFETEGKHTGDKWTGWSEKYKLKRYKLKRPEGKILTLDGHLRKDIRAYLNLIFGKTNNTLIFPLKISEQLFPLLLR